MPCTEKVNTQRGLVRFVINYSVFSKSIMYTSSLRTTFLGLKNDNFKGGVKDFGSPCLSEP